MKESNSFVSKHVTSNLRKLQKIWIHPRENSTQLREQCQTTSDCKSNFYDHYMHVLIHNLSVKLAIMKCRILIGINGALHHSWLLNKQQSITGFNVTLSNNRELFSAGWNKTKWIQWLILNRLIDTTVFEPTTLCFWPIHTNIGLCFTYLWSLNLLSPRNELSWLLYWVLMNLRTSSIIRLIMNFDTWI